MGNHIFGIDLGTNNIKIFEKSKKDILNEKNVIAIENKVNVFAIGDEAFEMAEKVPANIKVVFPVHFGVISDIQNMTKILIHLLGKMTKDNLKKSEFMVSVSSDITEVERRAISDLLEASTLKPKKVTVIDKAIADAIGVGVDVCSAKGAMIVNIGADTTEISILSLGGIVLSKMIKVGGNDLDECIVSTIKRERNLHIGNKTAENVKIKIGNAVKQPEVTAMVCGRDMVNGLPVEKEISSDLVFEAISEKLHHIVDNIKVILERTPPELGADIIKNGIYITGGSSKLGFFDQFLANETGLKVNTCERPEESVVRGLGEAILHPEKLTPKRKSKK